MSLAESEFARIMASTGAARMQGLMKLTRTNSLFAPGWAALAEEHWASRRREEALQAAKKALKLDIKLHDRFSVELRLASRSLLAEVRPPKPRAQPRPAPQADPVGEVVGARAGQMLNTALNLNDRDERLAVLEDLKEFAPNDPALLFHLARELAVVGRSEDARITGDELRKAAPDKYSELYTWASSSLAREQAAYEARSGGAQRQPAPQQPAPQQPAPQQSAPQQPAGRQPGRPEPVAPSARRPQQQPAPTPRRRPQQQQAPTPRRRPQPGPQPGGPPGQRPSQPPGQRPSQPPGQRPSQPPGHMGARGGHGAQPTQRGPQRPPRPNEPDAHSRPQPHGVAQKPASALDQVMSDLDRNLSARGIEQTPGEREFDEAATVDVALGDLGLEDESEDESEVTTRAKVSEMATPRPSNDAKTRRLQISELQDLVSASLDPELDK